MSPTLTESMTAAWQQRAQDAYDLLMNAAKAPGLFKPEAVEQARIDLGRALAEIARWS